MSRVVGSEMEGDVAVAHEEGRFLSGRSGVMRRASVDFRVGVYCGELRKIVGKAPLQSATDWQRKEALDRVMGRKS